jgi:hypothetical protein
MTRTILVTTIAITAFLASPARVYAQTPSEHAGHAAQQPVAAGSTQALEPGRAQSPASKPDIDALVLKMNAATGAAKVDAVAEVLTALVQKQKDCAAKMAGMMSKMGGDSAEPTDSHAAQ